MSSLELEQIVQSALKEIDLPGTVEIEYNLCKHMYILSFKPLWTDIFSNHTFMISEQELYSLTDLVETSIKTWLQGFRIKGFDHNHERGIIKKRLESYNGKLRDL
jgi:hypothetical protein